MSLKESGDISMKYGFVPVLLTTKLCWQLYVQSSNNRHTVSHFPYKCIVKSDMSTYINTLSDTPVFLILCNNAVQADLRTRKITSGIFDSSQA